MARLLPESSNTFSMRRDLDSTASNKVADSKIPMKYLLAASDFHS